MSDTGRSTYGKGQLVDDLTARTTGLNRRQISGVLDAALDLIKEKIQSGQNVTLTGFGTFKRTERAARAGMNIRTKEPIQIPARSAVVFSAGTEFKTALGTAGAGGGQRRGAPPGRQRERGGS